MHFLSMFDGAPEAAPMEILKRSTSLMYYHSIQTPTTKQELVFKNLKYPRLINNNTPSQF